MEKIKYQIAKLSKEHRWFREVVKFVRNTLRKLRYLVKYYYKYKVDDNIILFESFKGVSYTDSPKAIYEEMLNDERYNKYTFVWAFKDLEKERNFRNSDRTIVVKYGSSDFYKYFSKAKYIVYNDRLLVNVIKKKSQVCIQTWHGTPLKRLGCDIQVDYDNPYNTVKDVYKQYDTEGRLMDYLISPSKFTTEKLISTFNLRKLDKENIVIEEGYPRNDFLFTYTEEDVKRMKEKLKIPEGKKIILYAPTFRDNSHETGVGYTLDYEVDFELLQKELGDEYIILYRAHYFVAKYFDFQKYEGFVYDVSDIDDVNDVHIINDILITDYSSVFFDYANLKRPMLFFMYDLDSYQNKLRGFYLDLDELPGPITKTEKELVEYIKNIDRVVEENREKYKVFNEKFNYLDDGQASKRVLEKVKL